MSLTRISVLSFSTTLIGRWRAASFIEGVVTINAFSLELFTEHNNDFFVIYFKHMEDREQPLVAESHLTIKSTRPGADPGIWKGGGGLLSLLPFLSPLSLSFPFPLTLPLSPPIPVPLPFPPPLEVGPLKSS